jgi:branched-chain amino acid transport system permease protein
VTLYLVQLLIAGLALGSLYALTALGLVVIYNASTVVNFAHGAMGVAATYVAYVLVVNEHMPALPAAAIAIVAAFVLGVIVQSALLNRMREAQNLTQIVVTLGLFMFIVGVLGMVFGYNPRPFASLVTIDPVLLGNIVLRPQDIAQLALLIILSVALAIMFSTTKIGLGMRAINENSFAACLMGIPISRVLSIAWGAGIVLATIPAILAAPMASVTPNMMDTILIYGFVAAILGGFGSMVGAVIGGLVIGVLVNLVNAFLAPELAMSIVFGLLLIILYVKPDGLFGSKVVHKV